MSAFIVAVVQAIRHRRSLQAVVTTNIREHWPQSGRGR